MARYGHLRRFPGAHCTPEVARYGHLRRFPGAHYTPEVARYGHLRRFPGAHCTPEVAHCSLQVTFDHHAVSCKCDVDAMTRHNQLLRDVCMSAMSVQVVVSSTLTLQSLSCPGSDELVTGWERQHSLFDITVASSHSSTVRAAALATSTIVNLTRSLKSWVGYGFCCPGDLVERLGTFWLPLGLKTMVG